MAWGPRKQDPLPWPSPCAGHPVAAAALANCTLYSFVFSCVMCFLLWQTLPPPHPPALLLLPWSCSILSGPPVLCEHVGVWGACLWPRTLSSCLCAAL